MRLPTLILFLTLTTSGCSTEPQDTPSATVESHRQLANRWGQAVSDQDLETMGRLMAEDYVWHLPSEDVIGFENVKARFEGLFSAFPDFQLLPLDVVSDGIKVVVRWEVRGTHRGEFLGVGPTGNSVQFSTISIDLVSGGQFVEGWEAIDELGLRRQLGFNIETPR